MDELPPDAPPQASQQTLLRHELAERSGVNAETLRFYEKAGVLQPARLANGYRQYHESDLKRLKLIQRAVSLGFGLEDVKGWLEGDQESLEKGLEVLEQKQQDLEKLRKNLKKRLRNS
jgi:DNA-binding transcriptional MerR regulator